MQKQAHVHLIKLANAASLIRRMRCGQTSASLEKEAALSFGYFSSPKKVDTPRGVYNDYNTWWNNFWNLGKPRIVFEPETAFKRRRSEEIDRKFEKAQERQRDLLQHPAFHAVPTKHP